MYLHYGYQYDPGVPWGADESEKVHKSLYSYHLGVVVMGMKEGTEAHHCPFLDQPQLTPFMTSQVAERNGGKLLNVLALKSGHTDECQHQIRLKDLIGLPVSKVKIERKVRWATLSAACGVLIT